MTRMLVPAVLAAAIAAAALSPAPARAQSADDLVRVLVDVADVLIRNGRPYYRHGNFDADDRLVVVRDRRGRPTYYRRVPRHVVFDRGRGHERRVHCNKHGKCKVSYYDPRYDRDRDYDRVGWRQARRWRGDDDDDERWEDREERWEDD